MHEPRLRPDRCASAHRLALWGILLAVAATAGGSEFRHSPIVKAVQEAEGAVVNIHGRKTCLLYTSPSPRDGLLSRMPSSA